jgi:cell division protein FtsB
MERRRRIERLKAQNDELRRQLEAFREPAPRLPWEKDPRAREISDRELRRRLKIIEPGDIFLVVPAPTERPQQENAK